MFADVDLDRVNSLSISCKRLSDLKPCRYWLSMLRFVRGRSALLRATLSCATDGPSSYRLGKKQTVDSTLKVARSNEAV
jgi:hypothetical protein